MMRENTKLSIKDFDEKLQMYFLNKILVLCGFIILSIMAAIFKRNIMLLFLFLFFILIYGCFYFWQYIMCINGKVMKLIGKIKNVENNKKTEKIKKSLKFSDSRTSVTIEIEQGDTFQMFVNNKFKGKPGDTITVYCPINGIRMTNRDIYQCNSFLYFFLSR